jgi:crotonobetainyl-CoA:carnitine CoA-transferase CaiB-like acyl-CoA transferase
MDSNLGDRHGPLHGTTVLEFSHFLAGPYAGIILADLGAHVVKIEDIDHPDEARSVGPSFAGDESLYYLALNWGKRAFGVNLSKPGGRRLVLQLAAKADVVLDNYRPGVMAKLGLSHASLQEVSPRIITCSITGFGESGPYASRPAYDYTIQAISGTMSLTGDPGTPPSKAGISYVDHNGGMAAALAICAALFERVRTGSGVHIDLALLDVQMSMLTYLAAWQLNAGFDPIRTADSAHPSIVPAQNFATRDGHISLFVGNDATWRRFGGALNDFRFESADYATNAKRFERRKELVPLIQSVMSTRSSDEWVRLLNHSSIPCSRVNTISQALSDEHVRARGLIATAGDPHHSYRHVAGPLRTLGGAAQRGAPRLGSDTEDLLLELGYTSEAIAGLASEGSITLGEKGS